MPRPSLPDFPSELPHNPWPFLQPSREDLQFKLQTNPNPPQPRRLQQTGQAQTVVAASSSPFVSDLFSAIIRGIFVGVFFFALVYTFLPLHTFWLSNWHFLYPIGGIILLLILIGIDITSITVFLALLATALWFNWHLILTRPIIPLIFIVCGVIVICAWEFAPRVKNS